MADYPESGQQSYSGGLPQSQSPIPINHPDLAPPPCPPYSSQTHHQGSTFHQGYASNVVNSHGQTQVQPMPGAGMQPSAPFLPNQYPEQSIEADHAFNTSVDHPEDLADPPDDSDVDEDAPERADDGPQHPTESFDPIMGYECVAYNTISDIPPPAYEPPAESSRPDETFSAPGALSEKMVRDAILTFVDKNCCYGSRPAKQMNFNSIVPSSALHYQLESYTEARLTQRAHRPYTGDHVDGPECGRAPLPWEIPCQPVSMFSNHQQVLEVPHTSVIRTCFRCFGSGLLQCGKCRGKGRVRCAWCGGRGKKRHKTKHGHSTRRCSMCHGSGKRTCKRCLGNGHVTCHICQGFKSLRHYIELVVKFTNRLSDYILEGTDMPDELIRDVSGQVIFEQTLPYVWPISQYMVQQINENSIRIVDAHRRSWPTERIKMQRQNLRSVPVSEVAYSWKDVNTRFWVYGYEHEVHAPDYPHQCCWGCNIL